VDSPKIIFPGLKSSSPARNSALSTIGSGATAIGSEIPTKDPEPTATSETNIAEIDKALKDSKEAIKKSKETNKRINRLGSGPRKNQTSKY
jgi:hypothetical protein